MRRIRKVLSMVMVAVLTMVSFDSIEASAAAISELSVKTTGTTLREGQKLTLADAKKTVKVIASYKGGKKTTLKSYTVKEVGKTIKANSKGKYTFTITKGSVTKKVSVKVNKIKSLYLKQTKLTHVVAGSKFDEKKFRSKTTIMATYTKGSDKKLATYTVSAAKSVKANKNGEFVVTVKYGKKSTKVYIPVIAATPTPEVSTGSAIKPVPTGSAIETPVPTESVIVTPVPTDLVTGTPVPTDSVTDTTAPTTVAPVPTDSVTEEPVQTVAPTTAVPTPVATIPVVIVTIPVYITPRPVPTTAPTATTAPTPIPVGQKSYIVTLKRSGSGNVKFNNSAVSFTNDVATETVVAGTSVTVTASDSSSYQFKHWTNGLGTVLTANKSYTFSVNSNVNVTAVFEQVHTVTVKRVGAGKVTFSNSTMSFFSNVATEIVTAGTYSLAAQSTDEYEFSCWKDANGAVLSTDTALSLSVAGNKTVTAVFAEKATTVNVKYQHSDGTVIKTENVSFGASSTAPTNNVARLDKKFVGWKLNEVVYKGAYDAQTFVSGAGKDMYTEIAALTIAKKEVILTSIYEDLAITYTVTIENGEISVPSTLSGRSTVVVDANTYVEVIAKVPTGYKFSCWKDSTGQVISYDATYKKYINANVSLKAEFVEDNTVVETNPIVIFNDSGEVDVDQYAIRFNISSRIPASYAKLEWGVLMANYDDVELYYGNTDEYMYTLTDNTASTVKNADTRLTFTPGSYAKEYFKEWYDTAYARVYCRIQDSNGVTTTIYSSTITLTW